MRNPSIHIAEVVAELLLQIKAIQLNTENPFVWASGIESPIYCDNRLILSDVQARTRVIESMAAIVDEQEVDLDYVAGVATAGIAHGALLANQLGLPFAYVRSKPKGHGRQNQIEGFIPPGAKVLLIEDLISTGGSSLKAVEALRKADCQVLGVMAIFTYGLKKSIRAFNEAGCSLQTLSNFDVLIDRAVQKGYLSKDKINYLLEWRQSIDN
jgi:orotate phosphoribosyltransferase